MPHLVLPKWHITFWRDLSNTEMIFPEPDPIPSRRAAQMCCEWVGRIKHPLFSWLERRVIMLWGCVTAPPHTPDSAGDYLPSLLSLEVSKRVFQQPWFVPVGNPSFPLWGKVAGFRGSGSTYQRFLLTGINPSSRVHLERMAVEIPWGWKWNRFQIDGGR